MSGSQSRPSRIGRLIGLSSSNRYKWAFDAGKNCVLLTTVAIAIVVGTVVAYLPGMDAGFYFDDRPNILEASALHWSEWSPGNIRRIFSETKNPSRFVANLSFALNHLFSGLQAAAYHWTNLAIHLAVGGSLFWVTFLYSAKFAGDTSRRRWALMSSLLMTGIFLLHPLNIQAVTYVVQRMTALSTLLVLLSFGCYLSARSIPRNAGRHAVFGVSGLCWVLAVGGKEIALALPAVILLFEISLHRRFWRRHINTRRAQKSGVGWQIRALAVVAVVPAVVFVLYSTPDLVTWYERLPGREYSGYERVLTETRVHLFYLRLLVWPAPGLLNLDHEFSHSVSAFEPATAAAIVIWVVILFAAGLLAAVKPRYGFPLLAYLAFHVIESGPINLELAFEHRMYLPMTMLVLLGAAIITDLPKRYWAPMGVTVVALTIALGVANHRRNQTWADPIVFLHDCATKSPGKFRPQYNLGTQLGKLGRFAEAEAKLRHALQIKPGDSQAYNQLGNVYLLTKRRDTALVYYRVAVDADPNNAEAIYNLAKELEARGRMHEALALYGRFITIAPPWLEVHRQQVAARLGSLQKQSR